MIRSIIEKLLGDQNEKTIKKILPLVAQIKAKEEDLIPKLQTETDIKNKTSEFKERLKNGETLEDILPEAFATLKVACRHLQGKSWEVRGKSITWDMVPYDVQLIGGIVLHQGNIAEMRTGEGKTLVCTLPVYLNALTGKGVFVVTVNDYLAQRDAEWMSGLYNYLGLSVGVTLHGMTHAEKKAAYSCDITYGTNNEYGFDYLRDNMVTNKNNIVQRNLHYAIVDEVDSILIDEARTPLIISAAAEESTSKYTQYANLIAQLKETEHFVIDEKAKNAILTEEGIAKMEEVLGLKNIYTEAGFNEVHHIEQALKARACYKADIDYIIKDGEIIIIDEFTGRLMPGRRYSQGLHQAIEAKEKVEVKRESKTLATITFQNYFRLFEKLAGMTGTALTEAEEFYQIYGLDTVVIPTNKPIERKDVSDAVYKSQKGKFMAVAEKVKELHSAQRPVLVGTISVEKSEHISKLLQLKGVPHNVLNAKNHSKEAEIVENAGRKGAVTIATNMAGRGTDIKIDDEVKALGGLFVLGTERHESRRIDNQLRGRSGRQGDPGTSQFFVSMEDDLMRLFGADRIKNMMDAFNIPEDMPIENKMITRSIESAQKKVEGKNFDVRKHLVEYDDAMNIHREIIYKRRRQILESTNLHEEIIQLVENLAEYSAKAHFENRQELMENLSAIHRNENVFNLEKLNSFKEEHELIEFCKQYLTSSYQSKIREINDPEILNSIEKAVYLRTVDILWMEHINAMSSLRENVAFSGYAQKDPLTEYKSQAYVMFNQLLGAIDTNTVNTLFRIDIEKTIPKQVEEEQAEEMEDAEIEDGEIGRNDPCPCKSGKKYKKCHGQ